MAAERRRAVFLDRDGVLIREVDYLRRPEQLRLLKGAAEAVASLRRAGLAVVVITNQSGVARGYLTLGTLKKIHAKLKRDLRSKGARLDGIYFCPHHPEAGERLNCRCRKPKTGMIVDAARDLGLDVKRSFLVGDTTSDLAAARSAKMMGLLVRTGYGGRDGKHRVAAAKTFRDLPAAARWILGQL